MKDVMKGIGIFFAVLVIVLGLSWIFSGNDFFLYKYFAPKQEQVRREVFEQSKAYNQGMIQELQNMQFEYIKADSAHQKALASIILHRAADFDQEKLPTNLKEFVQKLKRERTGSRY